MKAILEELKNRKLVLHLQMDEFEVEKYLLQYGKLPKRILTRIMIDPLEEA